MSLSDAVLDAAGVPRSDWQSIKATHRLIEAQARAHVGKPGNPMDMGNGIAVRERMLEIYAIALNDARSDALRQHQKRTRKLP